MNKYIYINMEHEIKEELQKASKSNHQMVEGTNGQYVDAHFNMSDRQYSLEEIARGQVESILQLQTDSDTLRIIENVESENEVLDRIKWAKKKKKKKSPRAMY